jgi:acetyl-CoA carboxylase biotin carboxyl carrier protein
MDIKSEISGKVWKIEATPGTSVEEDDAIIILESMKMEIPVPAPKDGTVTEILVEEEELIEEGQVVARMET